MILSAFGKTLILCPLRDVIETTHYWRNPFPKTSPSLERRTTKPDSRTQFINSSKRSSETQGINIIFLPNS